MTRPPMRVRGEWKMRGRFLVGAAAVFGLVVGFSGAANAETCNDFRSSARKTNNLAELNNLRTLANGCNPSVINDIDAAIAAAQGGAPPAVATTPTATTTPVASSGAVAGSTLPAAPSSRPPAVRALTLGQAVSGNLSATSALDPERGGASDLWSFRANAGERIQVSMDAQNLDTYLVVGRMSGGAFVEIDRNDDRGDGTLNSRIRFTPEETGEYVVRARTFSSGQYGAYQLMVQPISSLQVTQAVPRPLTIGRVINGNLGPDSPMDEENGYSYDLWTFNAEAGQRLQIAMSAPQSNLDTYLVVGRMNGGAFEEVASNDDRGDGTFNSFVRFVPAQAGEYMVRARSFGREQYGSYELLVQPMAPVSARIPFDRETNAWTIQGELESEPTGDYADFEFQAARGKSYNVRVVGSGFAPMLDIGSLNGNRLTEVNFYEPGSSRAANSADFTADNRGRYIFRVSAPALASGQFDLIITETQ